MIWNELYAWMFLNPDGSEGVCLAPSDTPLGPAWFPLIRGTLEEALALEALARQSAGAKGMEVRIVHFHRSGVIRIQTLNPERN